MQYIPGIILAERKSFCICKHSHARQMAAVNTLPYTKEGYKNSIIFFVA
jgi:hypothetical protein